MPLSSERVLNKGLSGAELAEIIKKKVAEILERDGMLSSHIAYGRVAFEVKVTMHLDNPSYPEHVSTTLSRQVSKQDVAAHPELGALEMGPELKNPSDEAVTTAVESQNMIQSPNAARVENEMPVWGQRKNEAGVTVDTPIMYKGDMPSPAEVGNSSKIVDLKEKKAKVK